MARCILVIGVVVALIVAVTPLVLTDVPQLISFQGKLYNNAGNPLTGQYEITFRMYGVEEGGTVVWTETDSVSCEEGLYNIILGLRTPINLDFDGQYWLGVQVAGDDELSPRYRLVSVPSAFRAQVADQVSWTNLTDMPAGFADGTDDVGAAGGVSQINAGIGIEVTNPTGPTAIVAHAADASALPDAHHTKTTDASELTSGTLDDARFSAYSDLSAEGKIGTATDKVAAGDHDHDAVYVNEGQDNSITSGMIVNGTIQEDDLSFTPGGGDGHSLDAADGSPTDALSVDNDGNVGIGTKSPSHALHLHENSSGYTYVSFTNETTGPENGKGVLVGLDADEDFRVHSYEENNLKFMTNGTERLRITDTGKVGIGETNPSAMLTVNSNIAGVTPGPGIPRIYIGNPNGSAGISMGENSENYMSLDWLGGPSSYGRIYCTDNLILQDYGGNVGIGTADPTSKLYVTGDSSNPALMAINNGSGHAVMGQHSTSGNFGYLGCAQRGVVGRSLSDIGVYGDSDSGRGVYGVSYSGKGMYGSTTVGWAGYFTGPKSYFSRKVGIGTENPSHALQLHENSSGYTYVSFTNETTGPEDGKGVLVGLDANEDFRVHSYEDNNLKFLTNGTERVRINSDGNVGIGATAPGYKLHVVGDIAYTGNIYDVSDIRLKENITPLENAVEKVSSIRSIYFNNTGEPPDKREVGVIAQEVERVLPEVVSEDTDGFKSVDYTKLTPLLIEAVKELKLENEALRQEIDEIRKLMSK